VALGWFRHRGVNPGISFDRNSFERGGVVRLDGTFGFVVYRWRREWARDPSRGGRPEFSAGAGQRSASWLEGPRGSG